ncbi:MAG: TetR/AcrR family transcriptional regulator [Promicromonosporaceae bacterium]|nr:TetR/AcrR family transcriptional regulator [Promicromonosporaceae bacterium]
MAEPTAHPEPAARPGHTAQQARTQAAIIAAAIASLAADPKATMGEIARAAGVGRATIHRYFPERADLLKSLVDLALRNASAAHQRARLTEGTAREAVARLCSEYAELGPLQAILMAGALPDEEMDAHPLNAPQNAEVAAVLPRGHADGSLDPTLDEAWFMGTIWAYTTLAFEYMYQPGANRHAVVSEYLRRVDRAIRT